MAQDSQMKTTGKNFLFAVAIASIITFIFAVIGTLMTLFAGKEHYEAASLTIFLRDFFVFFQKVGICIVPVIAIFAFALLQRFRIKN